MGVIWSKNVDEAKEELSADRVTVNVKGRDRPGLKKQCGPLTVRCSIVTIQCMLPDFIDLRLS